MTSLSIFFGKSPEQAIIDLKKQKELDKREKIEKLLKGIRSEYNLWDMRCWMKYKDGQEVREWILNGCHPNNSGPVEYCIKQLLEMHVPEEVIIEAIMENPHKTFTKRIVPCFFDPMECPRYRKYGNYSDCNCSECCDT